MDSSYAATGARLLGLGSVGVAIGLTPAPSDADGEPWRVRAQFVDLAYQSLAVATDGPTLPGTEAAPPTHWDVISTASRFEIVWAAGGAVHHRTFCFDEPETEAPLGAGP